ncbi:MAG: hypothetical protein LAT67_02185 [Balneolales bacterium]|nr:hypothetical protein [Balneolales bacterium]
MKTLVNRSTTLILALVLLLSFSVNAQEKGETLLQADEQTISMSEADSLDISVNRPQTQLNDRNIHATLRAFELSLLSQNAGVRESALFHGFLLQLLYPEKEFTYLEQRIRHLAEREPDPRLRYKAELISYLMESGAWKEFLPMDSIPGEADFFEQAASIRHTSMLSSAK